MTMQIHAFEDDPLVDQVIQAQKELSKATNDGELMLAFARYFNRLSGCTHWLDLDVKGLAPGDFRLMDQVWFADPQLNAESVRRHNRWDENTNQIAIQRSEIISDLLLTSQPKYVADLDPQDDRVLCVIDAKETGMLAVPVYHGGEVTQWILLFRPMSVEFHAGQVRAGIANINLLSRAKSRIKLLNQVQALHQQVDSQLQEMLMAQRSLLPKNIPADPRIGIGISYQPCELAGGDYYDFNVFDTDKLGIVIADVSGHGAKAAVVMSMLRSLFAAHRHMGSIAGNVVDDINKVLVEITDACTFVTAYFLAFHFDENTAFYANAGHPPALCFDKNGKEKVVAQEASPPLGILAELPMLGGEIPLEAGDRIVMFTDGITEAADASGQEFGLPRLKALVANLTSQEAQSAADQIMQEVFDYSRGVDRQDDKCVLVIDYHG